MSKSSGFERFTKTEDAMIRARYPTEGSRKLAKELRRTTNSINEKAARMGITCINAGRPPHNASRDTKRRARQAATIERVVTVLKATQRPMTAAELAEITELGSLSIGAIIASVKDPRITIFVEHRNKKYQIADAAIAYSPPALRQKAEPRPSAAIANDLDHDAWYAMIKSAHQRKAALNQIRKRV